MVWNKCLEKLIAPALYTDGGGSLEGGGEYDTQLYKLGVLFLDV